MAALLLGLFIACIFTFALATPSALPPWVNQVPGVGTIYPCRVTLTDIMNTTELAYTARAACERSYFTGKDCDSYWRLEEYLLELENDYAACRKETIDNFLVFLVGTNWTNGEIARQASLTRDTIVFNAQQTQKQFKDQSELTREKMELEAQKTQNNLTEVTNMQNSFTRTNLTLEAQNTRTNVSLEAQSTRQTVETQSELTRDEVISQGGQTRTWISTEADATRNKVHDEHEQTRARVSTEADATRAEVDYQNENTRKNVSLESQQTRTVLTNVINTQAALSRSNTTQEATLTRTAVNDAATATQNFVATQESTTRTTLTNLIESNGERTRNAISADGASTRATVAQESNSTQNTVATTAANTANLIRQGVNTLNTTLTSMQTSQNNFEALFVKIMIQASFSTNADSGRIDLFQRPASTGGYFETMKAVVLDVVKNYYGNNPPTNINILLNGAESCENARNYKCAWYKLREAYLCASNP